MADRITPPSDTGPSLTALVSGIVDDLQTLIRQQVELARTEVKQEWEKTKTAAGALAAGAALLLLATFLLCFTLVHLLNYLAPGLPLWGCYAIVTACFGVLGGILVAAGRSKASQVRVVPPQTAQTIKENVQWIKSQT
jgi:hypothetical protein